MFAAQPVGKESVVTFCYGSLVYEEFSSVGSRFKTYGGNIMKVSRKTFLKYANPVPETAKNRNMVLDHVRTVPDPLCAMHYVNNRKYLSQDEALDSKKL